MRQGLSVPGEQSLGTSAPLTPQINVSRNWDWSHSARDIHALRVTVPREGGPPSLSVPPEANATGRTLDPCRPLNRRGLETAPGPQQVLHRRLLRHPLVQRLPLPPRAGVRRAGSQLPPAPRSPRRSAPRADPHLSRSPLDVRPVCNEGGGVPGSLCCARFVLTSWGDVRPRLHLPGGHSGIAVSRVPFRVPSPGPASCVSTPRVSSSAGPPPLLAPLPPLWHWVPAAGLTGSAAGWHRE